MSLQDKLDVIQNQFCLEIEEVEPTVYKVLNTDLEININKLQHSLEECILITSDQLRTEKYNYGCTIIAYMYYIILDYNRNDLKYKYHSQANTEFQDAVIDSYSKLKEEASYSSIDTIYRAEELVGNA